VHIVLKDETDFEGWRNAARALLNNNVDPSNIDWSIAGSPHDLLTTTEENFPFASEPSHPFRVPSGFISLAEQVAMHRDLSRFALLYRLLWRLRTTPDLMDMSIDPDIMTATKMAKAISRDQHKMKAFVRFREIGRDHHSRFIAWFEPAHYIVKATAPFFAGRFADMAWSILTPDQCVHWDGHQLMFTPGAQRSDAPSSDPLEHLWLTYYASIFNPARLKPQAMQKEMPKKYWRNLPEAPLIKDLMSRASQTTSVMIESGVTEPRSSQQRKAALPRRNEMPTTKPASPSEIAELHTSSLKDLREQAAECRACPLWKDATQTVFGEGAGHASAITRSRHARGRHRPKDRLRHQRRQAFQIRATR
jgi:DNA polymerase